jgi:hypothetical protein
MFSSRGRVPTLGSPGTGRSTIPFPSLATAMTTMVPGA